MKKGFTLLEILIVLAIIGILLAVSISIFTGVRPQARDDRRVADLFQVQAALKLFHAKCGFYPGTYDKVTNQCNESSFTGSTAWDDLANALKGAEAGIESIPNDPIPGANYGYSVQRGAGGIPKSQCYVLHAKMETEHRSLKDNKEIDDNSFLGYEIPNKGNFQPAPPNCKDDPGNWNYCVGNIECFYGK